MKKERFLDLVCESLGRLGANDEEIVKQRIHINAYLEDLGIENESEDLDYESPEEFARTIFKIIEARRPASPVLCDEDDNVKVFESEALPKEEEIITTEEESAEDEETSSGDEYFEDESEEDATREFSINELPAEENAEEEEDDYYEDDEIPVPPGNPVFFWIIAVLLSPVWIPLVLAGGIIAVLGYIMLAAFIVLYVPILILLILGGSVSILAELIYSIVKFVTGEAHIGLFEIGLGFIIAALTVSLSVIIYRYGTKYAKRHFRTYWRNIKRIRRNIKKAVWKLREVCSI